MLQDRDFVIYNEQYVYLGGRIHAGCLELTSEVTGDDIYPDSEKHYIFSETQTEKLFSLISLEEFVASCQSGHLLWMEHFLRTHGIRPKEWTY